jgi:hypothetical protein
MGEFRKFRQPRPAPGALVIGLIRELQPLEKLEVRDTGTDRVVERFHRYKDKNPV